MHVIAKKRLREFWAAHPDSEGQLKAWHAEAEEATWQMSTEVKARYPSASILKGSRVVFNICRNKYRLVVKVDYKSQLVFIRFIGTHRQYDRIDAETV